jgi:integrase
MIPVRVRHLMRQIMFTEPKIVTTNDLAYRSYIQFTFNGNRYREYNGKKLELKINPNRVANLKEKSRLLAKLLFEFKKALETGWNPTLLKLAVIVPIPEPSVSIEAAFKEFEFHKLNSPYSHIYKREIKNLVKQFLDFLTIEEKADDIGNLKANRVEDFLNQFKASATLYMNKRRTLGVFMAEFIRKKYISTNLAKVTPRIKTKASLHKIYTKEQLTAILHFLKNNSNELYLCCLLSYGCLLRPHQEIRFLKRKHFNDDLTTISLSGFENKSSRVRVVGIPDFVRKVLTERLTSISNPDSNIFSLNPEPYNEYYFSMNWTRLRKAMLNEGLLQTDQTIYSFRHTAAVDIFSRTKDLHILQQLLGHSTMIVTLKYLRGLGELNSQQLKDALPVLELI